MIKLRKSTRLEFLWASRNRVKSQLKQNKNYYAQKYSIAADTYFAPHWHDYFELEIVLGGSGEHIYNNQKYILERGSAYLMSYVESHTA